MLHIFQKQAGISKQGITEIAHEPLLSAASSGAGKGVTVLGWIDIRAQITLPVNKV